MTDTSTTAADPLDLTKLVGQASGKSAGTDIGTLARLATAGLQASEAKEKDPAIAAARERDQRRLAEDQAQVDKAFEGIEPLGDRVKPWDAKKEAAERTTDPFQAFGSAGSIFAVLASAFTHTPAINAINGMASAINAVRQNDKENYERAYEAWKQNTQLALDRHRAQYEDYQAAMEKARNDPAVMAQEMQMLTAKYDDKILAAHNALGDFATVDQIIQSRQNAALRWAELKPQIEAEHQKAVLAFGYDKQWAESAGGQQFLNSPEGQAWKKQNPGKIAPDQVHAINYFHAVKTATEASNPYSYGGGEQAYLKSLTDEKGRPLTAAEQLQAHSDWTKSGKTLSPVQSYIELEKQAALKAGREWTAADQAAAMQKWGRDSKGGLTDDGAQIVVDQYLAGDRQAIIGFARNPADKEKLTNMIAESAKARGITGPMLAVMSAEFQGLNAGERTLGTRTAQLGLASGELQAFIPQAIEASKKVDRTNFPSANAALQAYENQTGDPELRAFGAALNAVENAYSQIISRGAVSTDADKRVARELISTIDSPQVLDAVMNQIMKETQGASQAPGIVRDEYMKGFLLGRGEGPEQGVQPKPLTPPDSGITIREIK